MENERKSVFGAQFDKSKYGEVLTDQRLRVVEKIASAMEAGNFDWEREWTPAAGPYNPISGTRYKGVNRFNLSIISWFKNYKDPRWVTHNQVKEYNKQFYGEEPEIYKSKAITFKSAEETKNFEYTEHWTTYPIYKKDDEGQFVLDENGEKIVDTHGMRLDGIYRVYNAEQFINFPELKKEEYVKNTDVELEQMVKDLVASSRCPVEEDEFISAPCYKPTTDEIVMPLLPQFKSNASYIGTLLHEMGHSTMHPDALNRPEGCGNIKGFEGYAKEELIAELTSVFASSDLGVLISRDENDIHFKNHVAYLQNWASAIRETPAAFYNAATKAEAAADYIIGRYKEVIKERGEKLPQVEKLLKEEPGRQKIKQTKRRRSR